jgi:alpha-ketoglutarate-dependent taurine dioxygenase
MDGFVKEGSFPLVIKNDINPMSHPEFLQEITKNQENIKKLLLKHGALLFRGFPVEGADQFSQVIESLSLGEFVNYIGGDSPRNKVEKKVYTSTEAPPSLLIPLHQELSFMKKHPKHIYFYCDIAPKIKGETIIADARKVFEALNLDVKQRFYMNKVTYVSHYPYQNRIIKLVNRFQRSHKSWIEVFETSDKNAVEKLCIENEFDWKWLKKDWLEIKQTRPAIINHPFTKEMVWFNQAHLYDFNPKLLGWKNFIAAKLFYLRKSTRLHEVSFADGSIIPRKDLYHILETLNQNTVAFPWKKGDVLVLDNILAMHGRAPFNGPRRILTALTS